MRAREKVSVLAAGGACFVSIFFAGGAFRWAQAIVGVLVAIALAAQIPSRRALTRLSPLLALPLTALALTALQLIPLPHVVVTSFDLTGEMLRSDGSALLGVEPYTGLSLDLPNSLHAISHFAILVGVALVSLRFAAASTGRYWLLATIAVLCGLTALVAGLHTLVGAHQLYGIYAPLQATPPILGPLLNANHLGCLMSFGAILSLALLVYPNQRSATRGMWGAIALGCIAVTMATLSRGATLALVIGVGTGIAVLLAQKLSPGAGKRRRRRFIQTTLPIGIVAVCGLVVVVLMNATNVSDQIANTSLQEIHEPRSKYAAWSSSTALIDEAPWFGIGRGALEPALTRVHPASAFVTFSHLENEYIQAVVEWGVPGTAILGILFAWLCVVGARRWRDGPLAAGSLGALAVVAAQSNVDFGVELLGLAVPVTAVAASFAYVPLHEMSRRVIGRVRVVRGLVVVALLGACSLLLLPITRSVAEEHELLAHDDDLTLDDVREAVWRHPLDYYAYARAADLMLRTNDPDAIKLLNHALVLHPTHAGLHRLAGRVLHHVHRDPQAALEYADALQGTLDPRSILTEITDVFTSPEDAAEAIPVDFENTDAIVRSLVSTKHEAVAMRWLGLVLDKRPKDLSACQMLYDLAVQREDLAAAEVAARRCLAILPNHKSHLALAKVLLARGAFVEVEREVSDAETWVDGRIDTKATAWLALCDAKLGQKKWDDAVHCLHRLDASGLMPGPKHNDLVSRLQKIDDERHDASSEAPAP